jgi:hypothetical protein
MYWASLLEINNPLYNDISTTLRKFKVAWLLFYLHLVEYIQNPNCPKDTPEVGLVGINGFPIRKMIN